MANLSSDPVHASVLYARLGGLASRPVGEQAALKERLEAQARDAIAECPARERVVLDAEDGLAIVFFGAAGSALQAARALVGDDTPGLCLGVNYGPLALVSQEPDAAVYGDGLAAAAAAARFAQPGRPLVTEDFARTLEAREPERARSLAPAGNFTDTRVRLHSLYTPDPGRAAAARRDGLRAAVLGIVAILLLGTAARLTRELLLPPDPAVVTFAIRPDGEIVVDGELRGRTPPIKRLELPPGRHELTVQRAGAPPVDLALDLDPGQQLRIGHAFPRRAGEVEPAAEAGVPRKPGTS